MALVGTAPETAPTAVVVPAVVVPTVVAPAAVVPTVATPAAVVPTVVAPAAVAARPLQVPRLAGPFVCRKCLLFTRPTVAFTRLDDGEKRRLSNRHSVGIAAVLRELQPPLVRLQNAIRQLS